MGVLISSHQMRAVQSPTVMKNFAKNVLRITEYTGPWCPLNVCEILSCGDLPRLKLGGGDICKLLCGHTQCTLAKLELHSLDVDEPQCGLASMSAYRAILQSPLKQPKFPQKSNHISVGHLLHPL